MNNHLIKWRDVCLIIGTIAIWFVAPSCKKQDKWLDAKSVKSDVTPKTIQDFQAILDNTSVMNGGGSILGLVGTDNIFIPDANLDATDQVSRNTYLWAKDIYQGANAVDWSLNYQVVEYCNIVLDGLKNTNTSGDNAAVQNIKGSALFYRAYAFFQLCQLYCKTYNKTTSQTDLGIPLRMSSDVNVKSVRATVEESYLQVLNDLKTATGLLPETPLYKTRPSSTASNALLAKVYLAMGDYDHALQYAGMALSKYGVLLNYNSLNITSSNPFPTLAKGHPEVIFHAVTYGNTTVISQASVKSRVSPELYQSYEAADLRKTAFYTADGSTGLYKFKASYAAQPYNFCGLATDELYLIRAECFARTGDLAAALNDLNSLLKNRYKPAAYAPFSTDDPFILLTKIILERRKELPFTGNLRWEDLKRLNGDNKLQISLIRTSHKVSYSLGPNDPRYILPIPNDEIQLNNLQQNER